MNDDDLDVHRKWVRAHESNVHQAEAARRTTILLDEVERTRRGAQTLGRAIERQGRDVLDATGLHDWIDEDGDGDWAAVWENLHELRPALKRAEAERDRLAATVDRVREVCAEHWEHQTRREAKFGRTGSSCICLACEVMRAIEGADS